MKAQDYELLTATSGERALLIAQKAKPDLILLDVRMPGIDGFETCLRLKTLEDTKEIPVIFLTASKEVEAKVKGFKVGGVDYIIKPFYQEEVIARVETHLKINRLTRKLKEANDRLSELSIRDPLTNLYNRRYYFEKVAEEIKKAMRREGSIAIAIFDLDFFKDVNDTYGHLCGDFVLKALSSLICEEIRETDLVARYGGEEFIAAFFDAEPDGIYEKLERKRKKIELHQFLFEETTIKKTVSIGYTICQLNQNSNVKVRDLVNEADTALYHAKETGKNKVVFFIDRNLDEI